MNAYGYWMFGLAFAYTALLIAITQIAKKKAKQGEDFFVGGRSFSRWTVAFCITGLFSGSTFISILELAYLKGVSAMWYGVAELSHVLIIALVLIGPFRKRMMVTISGLIGDKYGKWAKGIAGAITAFTFPMWSVATALAFASCINALTGLDLMTSVIITAALLYAFLQAGGMWSVAFTQTANFFAFMAMFMVGFYALMINPGLDGIAQMALKRPELFQMGTDAPISMKIVEVNLQLEDSPEIINSSPYDYGWLVKVEILNREELEHLLTEEQYLQMIREN